MNVSSGHSPSVRWQGSEIALLRLAHGEGPVPAWNATAAGAGMNGRFHALASFPASRA